MTGTESGSSLQYDMPKKVAQLAQVHSTADSCSLGKV